MDYSERPIHRTDLLSEMDRLTERRVQHSPRRTPRRHFIIFLYKIYINPYLMGLKQNRLGRFIGGTNCGCPTCADDLALISDCENELQVMTSVVRRHVRKTMLLFTQTNRTLFC